MASIDLCSVTKTYPGGKTVMENFDLHVRDGSFTVLVGPSGCGKTTSIRMIAGLEELTAGDVKIDGEVVTHQEPGERGIAMVFQNYALYPHMTVEKNIAFGLKNLGYSKAEIEASVTEVLEMVGLTEYRHAKPGQLSGGQRQRVALARAISKRPKVFLMDEPLSNLDAKLRVQMRSELVRMHQKLGTTFVYITHDQVEAMTMGDYIAVLRDGKIMQYDTPQEVYSNPANLFTARFIGDPGMNCLHLPEGGYVGFRSRKVRLGRGDGALGLRFRAELSTKERLGGEFNYTVMLDGTTEIVIRSEEDLPTGQLLDFFVSREDLYAFHENEERILLEELPAESEGASYTLTLAETIACQARRVG